MKILKTILHLIFFIIQFIKITIIYLTLYLLNMKILKTYLLPTKFQLNYLNFIKYLNTKFLYYISDILLNNTTNKLLIKYITYIQNKIMLLGISTGMVLCKTNSVHNKTGLILRYQCYPYPLSINIIYFAIWFTLITELKFTNIDNKIVFISRGYTSIFGSYTESDIEEEDFKENLGNFKPGLCNLLSEVKTLPNIEGSLWFSLHNNFTWELNQSTFLDFILASKQTMNHILSKQDYVGTKINEVHITCWGVGKYFKDNKKNKKL